MLAADIVFHFGKKDRPLRAEHSPGIMLNRTKTLALHANHCEDLQRAQAELKSAAFALRRVGNGIGGGVHRCIIWDRGQQGQEISKRPIYGRESAQ